MAQTFLSVRFLKEEHRHECLFYRSCNRPQTQFVEMLTILHTHILFDAQARMRVRLEPW